MRDDIAKFPPPVDSGQLIGHDGGLAPEEVKHLAGLGYVVAHWKSFSGQKLVQAYFEGLAKGLIELDPKTFKAIDTMRKQLSKVDAGESDLKATDRGGRPDILGVLRGGFEFENQSQEKRRGRPPKVK